MPAPTDCCEWVANEGRGRATARLCSWRVVARLRVVTQGPSTPQSPNGDSPDKGPLCGVRGTPEFKVEEGAGALRTKVILLSFSPRPSTSLGVLGRAAQVAGPLRRNSGSFLWFFLCCQRRTTPGGCRSRVSLFSPAAGSPQWPQTSKRSRTTRWRTASRPKSANRPGR